MNRNFLCLASLLLVLMGAAWGQAGAMQNTLTNHDIVVLAQAGFNENFIADFIAMSRTRFDTSVAGLAELAKEGLNERLIRVMLTASQPGGTPAAEPAPAAAVIPAAVIAAPMETSRLKRGTKQNESSMAIANQAPYYRSASIFWGLWKRKTGVGAGRRMEQPINGQMGTAYNQVLLNPAGVSGRYVAIP